MSLILDALNRSREDRDEVPGLGTRHEYTENEPDRRSLVLGVALALAVGLIAWLLWQRGETPQPAVIDSADRASPAAVALPETDAAVPKQAVATPAKAGPSPPAPAEKAREPQRKASPEPGTAATEIPAAAESAGRAVAELYQAPQPAAAPREEQVPEPEPVARSRQQTTPEQQAAPAQAAPATEESDLNIEQLVRQAEDELENARLAEHPAPFINELSQRTKDSIPTVYYQQHDYSGRPGQSRVVLNGKSLKKGGSPASGMKVEEILPDSVVLNYGGTQFRLRALNSWVNL